MTYETTKLEGKLTKAKGAADKATIRYAGKAAKLESQAAYKMMKTNRLFMTKTRRKKLMDDARYLQQRADVGNAAMQKADAKVASLQAKINRYKYDIDMLEKVADKLSIDEIKSYDTGAKGYLADKMWDRFTKDEKRASSADFDGIVVVDKKGNVTQRAKVTGYNNNNSSVTVKQIRDLAMDKNEKARYKKYFGKNMDDMDDSEFAEEFSKYNAIAERASKRMNPSVIEGWNQGYPGYEKKYNDEFNRLFDEEAKKRRK